MRGYQFLENDFFDLCKTREIGRIPMLLYIYLRGLYCRFQKPIFYCFDKQIKEHLGISQSTLARARQFLQKRGMIKFRSGKGTNPTEYTMLGTVLLPIVKTQRGIVKKKTPCRQPRTYGCRQFDDTLLSINERVKKKIDVFQGISEEDRAYLEVKGIVIARSTATEGGGTTKQSRKEK